MRGMFAFALWDEKQQQLFLARIVWIKPLTMPNMGSAHLCFRIKAILTQRNFPPVNLPALQAMLTLGFVPARHHVKGIYKLPPPIFDCQNGAFHIKKYWLSYQEINISRKLRR